MEIKKKDNIQIKGHVANMFKVSNPDTWLEYFCLFVLFLEDIVIVNIFRTTYMNYFNKSN